MVKKAAQDPKDGSLQMKVVYDSYSVRSDSISSLLDPTQPRRTPTPRCSP